MFSEKLIISNFGPFQERVEFEFKKYSFIIGPQASGKSIVAKLITIFRNEHLVKGFNDSLKDFGIFIFLNKNTVISYYSHLYNIVYRNEKIDIELNEVIKAANEDDRQDNIDALTKEYDQNRTNFDDAQQKITNIIEYIKRIPIDEKESYIKEADDLLALIKKYADEERIIISKIKVENDHLSNVIKQLKTIQYFKPSFYIPSERLFYSMFKESLASIIKAEIPLPKILIDFGAMIENLRNRNESKTIHFQDIKFESSNEELNIVKGNNVIPISFASSGIQSLYPLLLISQALIDKEIFTSEDTEYISIAIEEPELNLYPLAQNSVIKKIIESANTNAKVRLVITTHSPYVLTTLNNLLFKSKVSKLIEDKVDSGITSVIKFDDKINFEDISAYSIDEGKAINLIDEQTQLINAKKLDSISYTINDEYSELMTLYRKLNG